MKPNKVADSRESREDRYRASYQRQRLHTEDSSAYFALRESLSSDIIRRLLRLENMRKGKGDEQHH